MFAELHNYLIEMKAKNVFAFSVVIIFLLGVVDHQIGPEISFSVFYIMPIFVATWYGSKSFGQISSLIAAIVWLFADLTAGHIYTNDFIPVWNVGVRLAFFLVLTTLLWIIKQKLEIEESLADTDALTDLANRRFFMERLDLELSRANRYKHVFTMAYIDLDNFKLINDLQGHDVGDEVLKTVAFQLRNNVRKTDLVSRLGGDEFAVIFPNLTKQSAEELLQNLQKQLLMVMQEHDWPITFSIGAISFVHTMQTSGDMIKAVDDLMYQVKRTGKNNLVCQVWPRLSVVASEKA